MHFQSQLKRSGFELPVLKVKYSSYFLVILELPVLKFLQFFVAIYSPLDSGLYQAVPTIVPTAMSPYSSSSQNIPPYLRLSFILPLAIAAVIISIACVGAYVYVRIDDRKARLKAMTSGMGGNTIYGGTIAISPGKRFHYVTGPGPFTGQATGNGPFSPKHDSGFAGGAETQSLVSEESSMSFRYTDAGAGDHKKLLNANGRMLQLPGLQPWAQSPIMEEDEAIVEVADSCAYETLPFQRVQNHHLDSQFQPLTSTPMKSFLSGSVVDTLPPPPPPLPVTNKPNITSAASTMSRASFPPPPPPISSNSGTLKPSKSTNNAQFCQVDIHHVISDNNRSDSYDDFHLFGAQV